ncbi:MAG: sporulation transcription factor Spo0A, partial [Firmicutes bacterium]|nr:sporulation transcription factor Spo0A [Bacillota bacterium]
MKTRIMLVDDNEEFVAELKNFFEGNERFEVAGVAENGVKAVQLFQSLKPDVMLLDLVMPQMDGFSVLERIQKASSKVIVVSALSQDAFIHKAMNLGADYYMQKPVSLSNLADRIADALSPAPAPALRAATTPSPSSQRLVRHGSLDEKITNIFITVGIPAHIKGYHFLREAIKMAIDNPEIINNITKKLYPDVAGKFNT